MDSATGKGRLNLREVMASGWNVFLLNARSIMMVMLVVHIPINAMLALSNSSFLAGQENSSDLSFFVTLLQLSQLFLGLLAVMATAAIVEASVLKNPVTWQEAFKKGFSYWSVAVFTTILEAVILVMMTLLLIIPGIIWANYYAFVIFAVVLRGRSGRDALRYSKRIVEGQWWRVFGYRLVIGLPAALISVCLTMIDNIIPNIMFLSFILDTLGIVLFTPFLVMTIVFFLDNDYATSPEAPL